MLIHEKKKGDRERYTIKIHSRSLLQRKGENDCSYFGEKVAKHAVNIENMNSTDTLLA